MLPQYCTHTILEIFFCLLNHFVGTHTPCSFFNSVEFSRTLLDDHLLEPGYHPALLGLAREEKSDLNFHFDHDLMALSALL